VTHDQTYSPDIEALLGGAEEKTYSPDVEALIGGSPVGELDRPVSVVTPETGQPLAMGGGAYEASSLFDNSIAFWTPPIRSADADILPDKSLADSRVRDMTRNDAYTASGVDVHRDSIVGGMFLLNAKPEYKVLGLDEVWAQEFQEEAETKFTLWAESLDNWVDASRMNTLTGLTRLAVGIDMLAGEVLAAVEWLRDPGRSFSTAIQMIDLDRLCNPDYSMDTETMRGGVLRDTYGAPKGYYIRMAHPSDFHNPDSMRWKFVPTRKPWGRLQMLHIVDQTRPAQSRGISRLVAGLKEMKITKKWRDIMLQNAVVNASFAASIESELPAEAVFQQLGSGNVGEGVTGYAEAYLGAIAKYAGNSRAMQLNGVKIPHLFPGTKLQLRPAGQGGPLGTEFEESLLRYLAAAFNVSYEQISHDYSKSNYSSIKAGINETMKGMQAKKRMTADRFASAIYALWLEEAINNGSITSLPRNAPNWYDGLNKEAYCSCEWIGASRGQVDELKETQAAVLRLQNNITTYEDEMARLGKDWRKVLVQRERENKEMKARGLVQEQSNMMNAASGAPRQKKVGNPGGQNA